MEKKYSFLLLFVAIIALIFTIFTTDNLFTEAFNLNDATIVLKKTNVEIVDGYYISKYIKLAEKTWEEINTENCQYEDAKDLLSDMDYYIETISKTIDMQNWIELHRTKYRSDYYFNPYTELSFIENSEGLSYSDSYLKLRIKLHKQNFENDYSTIVGELVNIITGKSVSSSLTEGLSLYFQDELGNNVTRYNYGIDIHTIAKQYITNDYNNIFKRIGTTHGNVVAEKRTAYYVLSNSFCRYLIEQYGMYNFMKVYMADNTEEAYVNVYNKDIDELKKEWLVCVKNYDDIINLSKEYISEKRIVRKVGTIQDINTVNGSIKNKPYFVLEKSFQEYLIRTYGLEKFNLLSILNYNYYYTFGKELNNLRDDWIKYVKEYY